MSDNRHSDKLKLGFMTAVEVEGRGYVGGLLITNHNGRPLEFQCTTPVKPNRTQEILYGKMLKPWLLGELIGKTLLDRVSIKPDVIVTESSDVLELRNHTDVPVACTIPDDDATSASGERRLRFHHSHTSDQDVVASRLDRIPGAADLEEPLERVREALNETIRTVLTR